MTNLPGPEQYTKPASPVRVVSGWLEFDRRLPLFKALESGPWHSLTLRYGNTARRKNIVFYDGDSEAAFNYTKKATDKDPPIHYADGPAELREVRSRLQQEYGYSFSLCYVNYYCDESVGIFWHNDTEEAGSKVPVRMLCLGGKRIFSIWKVRRDEHGKLQKPFAEWEEETASGDLVEMPVGFHEEDAFRHAVLPQKRFSAPRISLTFRSPDLSSNGPWAPKPQVFCCRAGHEYPPDAVYVGCKVVSRHKGGAVIREGTIFGNDHNPLVGHRDWIAKSAGKFREYAVEKLEDPAFRQQAVTTVRQASPLLVLSRRTQACKVLSCASVVGVDQPTKYRLENP
jgi:alkylated DNA repair dioxygenase AlkB